MITHKLCYEQQKVQVRRSRKDVSASQTKQTKKKKEFKDSDHWLKTSMKIRNWMRSNCGQMWRQVREGTIDIKTWYTKKSIPFDGLITRITHSVTIKNVARHITTDKSRLSWTQIIDEICVFSKFAPNKLTLNKGYVTVRLLQIRRQ